ncbi:hypothetical protein M6D93_01635 [Jatrophihabitans telluris]|uniref:Uncharacterized protein n=1 Tax=Jatrophihabitans telluris TaxID=2038343 RepID=A0ABY4QZR4_9ACTN|nr:hypothetical protein [Jatrophihabitans telluris]UQX88717.1 hypothetical protein M6D93_01635 [Jatrophihabitans telluris]
MDPGLLALDVPRRQQRLDLFPGVVVDEGRMLPVVLDTPVGHPADVVAAAQEAM